MATKPASRNHASRRPLYLRYWRRATGTVRPGKLTLDRPRRGSCPSHRLIGRHRDERHRATRATPLAPSSTAPRPRHSMQRVALGRLHGYHPGSSSSIKLSCDQLLANCLGYSSSRSRRWPLPRGRTRSRAARRFDDRPTPSHGTVHHPSSMVPRDLRANRRIHSWWNGWGRNYHVCTTRRSSPWILREDLISGAQQQAVIAHHPATPQIQRRRACGRHPVIEFPLAELVITIGTYEMLALWAFQSSRSSGSPSRTFMHLS
ncbi:hypothetical protein Ae717Ps2_5559c [Pseudonocardia sp. Ae717_Ps2]|nr:hypothetical protein Ae717Ps2_5559c [Pseudonocardia sp. Ae717_Ps2]